MSMTRTFLRRHSCQSHLWRLALRPCSCIEGGDERQRREDLIFLTPIIRCRAAVSRRQKTSRQSWPRHSLRDDCSGRRSPTLRGFMDADTLHRTFPDGTVAAGFLFGGWFWPLVVVGLVSYRERAAHKK